MRNRTVYTLLFVLLATLLVAATACTSDDDAGDATATASPVPNVMNTPPGATPTVNPATYSLVYADTSRGQGTDIYTAAYDGANPKLVVTLPQGARVMDVRGKNLAAAHLMRVMLVDLQTGAIRIFDATARVSEGRFVDHNTFIYTTSIGCGPDTTPPAALVKIDLPNNRVTDLAKPGAPNLSIAGLDASLNQVAVVLRPCDVAVTDFAVYDIRNGQEVQIVVSPGCGWVAASLSTKRALVSWKACNVAAKAAIDGTAYNFNGVGTDFKAPGGGSTLRPYLLRPGKNEGAAATYQALTPSPGANTQSTGIWLVDIMNLNFTMLVPGSGPEQWPVAWSPDGGLLLVATVEAQGRCTYSYIEVASKTQKAIDEAITVCGVNGDVVGWTVVR